MNNFYPWLNFTRQLKLNSSMIALQLKNLSWTLHEEIIHKPVWTVSVGAKNYSKPSDYGRQLGGYEHKEDIEGFKSLSRTPILEKEGFWKSKLSVFATKKFSRNLLKYNPSNFKFLDFKNNKRKKSMERLIFEQRFVEHRLEILGCDLAAAHFAVYRGGAVKFYNDTDWIRDDKNTKSDYDDDLPNAYTPDYVVEAIDFSGVPIVYEGLRNVENLQALRGLSFAFCPYFDNWLLDRVSGEFCETLEYLDISFTHITAHGLDALYRFKKLKTLKLYGFSDNPEFILVCNELKRDFPDISIKGMSIEESEMEDENIKVEV